jgi:Ricin-type beta-trefoil lectin domain/Domain of unknown function (DUF5122) beta-propeller
MRARLSSVLTACAATVAVAGVITAPALGSTRAASHVTAARAAALSPQSAALPDLVSATPVSWTPNVFAGSPSCDTQWFGSNCTLSTVYATAVVNGEVVVAGAFTQACAPGPASAGYCTPGTTVTRNDIFAYQPGTGTIDPGFVPVLDRGPVYALAAGPGNTVYAAGAFTTVNGTSHAGVVQLSVAPGSPGDGQVVSAFAGQVQGTVNAVAYQGNALYAGGQFSSADGAPSTGLVRLNATTGAADNSFGFTLGSQATGTSLQVTTLALTPDGSHLAVGGSFLQVNGQSRPRLALISTGGSLGATATLANWSAPIMANNCKKEHNYVRDIDFSSDGSFFVVVDSGYEPAGGSPGICDAAARFETGATDTKVPPVWINFTGGDTIQSVAVAGAIVYLGGHERWVNNECGSNHVCEDNAVLVNGIAAIDANTGLALPWWQPGTTRGVGVESLTPVPAGTVSGFGGGLLVGTDVQTIGGTFHGENALFPLTSTAAQAPGGPIPSGMFSLGRPGGQAGTTSGRAAMCVDDTGNSAATGNPVDFYTCRNQASQNWTVEPDGTIQINGMCMDVIGSPTAPPNGTKIDLGSCNGAATQHWQAGPGNTLVNHADGKCLDDPAASTSNGTQLQVWNCNGNVQQVWPLPAAQAPPPPPPTGPVSSQLVESSTAVPCMDDTAGAATPGTPVEISDCLENSQQAWTVESDGTIRIQGLCLDTAAGGTAGGTPVVLNTCNGSATQVWAYGGSSHALTNRGANECLAIPGSGAVKGTQLQIASCNGASNEAWRLPAV